MLILFHNLIVSRLHFILCSVLRIFCRRGRGQSCVIDGTVEGLSCQQKWALRKQHGQGSASAEVMQVRAEEGSGKRARSDASVFTVFCVRSGFGTKRVFVCLFGEHMLSTQTI